MDTVLLLLENNRNKTLLFDWFKNKYAVVADSGDALQAPFDICIVDGPALTRLKDEIISRKATEPSLYLPILLVTTKQQVSLLTSAVWQVIDDVITTPISKPELHARVEVLLRSRRYSQQILAQMESQLSDERQQSAIVQERLLSAIEQTSEAVVITAPDGIIQYVNPAFERLTGYTRLEAIGQTPRILKSGQQDGSIYRDMWETLLNKKTWSGRLINSRKDGSLFTEEATITPVLNSEGTIQNFVAVKRDITAYLEVLEEKNRIEQQLRQAQKMEAVGQLAGGIAHDFNNILTVISGYCSLLQMKNDLNKDQQAQLFEIATAAEKAAQLTHGLLAFSRKQPMMMKNENLNEIVQHIHKFLVRIIGEDITLDTACNGPELSIIVDRGQIEQVLINLATNARDAMPNGGTLSIKSEIVIINSFPKDFRNIDVPPGKYALLTVADTGTGISKEHIDHIFEPFFTTKEVGKGTGLGMAIIYGIIKQHNGFIDLCSKPSQGTVFQIYLPIQETNGKQLREKTEPMLLEGGNETILVAEDDPAVRSLVSKILTRYGYEIILAEDGLDALEKFKSNKHKINLILMDMIMPKKSGKETFEEIQRSKPGIKVLFSSGYTADFIENRGISEDGIELIMKPVQPMELIRKVREILDR